MLNPLDTVDWSSLTHAFGEADDVPGLVAQLLEDEWQDAADELTSMLVPGDEVFPATVVALPFLVEVALDPEAAGRSGALQLLGAYGESLSRGAGPDFLRAEATAALRETAQAVLPLAADPNPEVRAAVYQAGVWLPEAAWFLRERLEGEQDSLVPLVEALTRLRDFDAGDLDRLRSIGRDDAVFAAAWASLASGHEIPGAADDLVRLWPAFDRDDLLGRLVRAAGGRAVPVLSGLGGVAGVTVGELAWAWHDLALVSRAALEPARDSLLALADRAGAADLEDLLGALISVLPLAVDSRPVDSPPADSRPADARADGFRSADAVAGNSRAADSLARLVPESPEGEAALAVALLVMGDGRWASHARAVLAAPELPYFGIGGASVDFASALAGFADHDRDGPELVALARAAITAWPTTADSWTELLGRVPASTALVEVLLLAAPSKAAVRLLARLAFAQPAVFDGATHSAIHDLPVPGGDTGAWLLITQALLDSGDPAAFSRAWRISESGPGEDELLRIWATHTSPGVDVVCLDLITRTTWGMYRSRAVQVAALEILLAPVLTGAQDLPEPAWPALLGLLEVAGGALPGAVRLGNRLVAVRPELCPEWLAALHRLPDPVAVEALQALGDIAPERALELAVAGLREAAGTRRIAETVPPASRVIRNALADRPDLRPGVTADLAPLVAGDERTLVPGDIRADTHLQCTLATALSP
ncbi:hypothetical protein [Kineosporia sp. NBRC 101731]|uniref:hypothetical protein n=1 Tax=Kineosporia sp. NBRC 101731 TaxID=3032199 RepID=UPI0024A52603|nr:hypothetical protein [Kineosporia sp. NBRC 101731]GLY32968.1 hypothetical protein Kisp02_63330 [Kineosporia sp. NBRC 101731]